MRPILLTLLLIPFYLSATEIFLLPDHTTDALRTIDIAIKNSKKEVLIITPALQSQKLEKSLKKTVDSRVGTTLILSGKHAFKASKLLQYRHIDLRTLNGLQGDHLSGKLSATLLLFDQKEVCFSTVSLDEEMMRHHIGFLECSREPQRVKTYLRHAETLKARSQTYLK